MALRENYTNTEAMADNHPTAHNEANDLVNSHTDQIGAILTSIGSILNTLGIDPGGAWADLTTRLGVMDIANISAGLGIAPHGSNASFTRPNAGFRNYVWVGSVQPNNWLNEDIWLDTTP
jgi:hypothetical protein